MLISIDPQVFSVTPKDPFIILLEPLNLEAIIQIGN